MQTTKTNTRRPRTCNDDIAFIFLQLDQTFFGTRFQERLDILVRGVLDIDEIPIWWETGLPVSRGVNSNGVSQGHSPARPLGPSAAAGRAGSTYELQNVEAGIGNVDGGTLARVVPIACNIAARRHSETSVRRR